MPNIQITHVHKKMRAFNQIHTIYRCNKTSRKFVHCTQKKIIKRFFVGLEIHVFYTNEEISVNFYYKIPDNSTDSHKLSFFFESYVKVIF